MLRLLFSLVMTFSLFGVVSARAADPHTQIVPLEPGLHLGYGTFAPIPGETLPALDERIAEATTAGMDVARVMVDWAEIESEPGEYDLALLNDQLERVPEGSRLFLTLGVTDIDHYSVPPDLLDSDDELVAPLDDPEIVGRYLELLDAVLPELIEEHGLFALSVANEPDDMLSERPAGEATDLAIFTTEVSDFAAESFGELPVTVTISGPGIAFARDFVPELVAATDIAAFNWSCLDFETFLTIGPETIASEIDLILAAADGREIILQELSCASGYVDQESFIGSTPESQAAWFDQFFTAMAAEPQFRAAFVLDLIDWPADLAAESTDFLRGEGLDDIADRYGEFLATWGLLTIDLTPKPAWQVFLDHLAA